MKQLPMQFTRKYLFRERNASCECRVTIPASDLQYVAFARHHFIQHRVHEES